MLGSHRVRGNAQIGVLGMKAGLSTKRSHCRFSWYRTGVFVTKCFPADLVYLLCDFGMPSGPKCEFQKPSESARWLRESLSGKLQQVFKHHVTPNGATCWHLHSANHVFFPVSGRWRRQCRRVQLHSRIPPHVHMMNNSGVSFFPEAAFFAILYRSAGRLKLRLAFRRGNVSCTSVSSSPSARQV